MEPIGKANLSRAVLKSILQSIKDEQFKAGDKLPPIKELSETLEVGISSVREGLKQLQSMGVVRIVQGKGVYINENLDLQYFLNNFKFLLTLKKQEFTAIMEARQIIESETAGLAAMRAEAAETDDLSAIILKMNESAHDLKSYNILDLKFHMAIAKISKNPVLVMFLESIQGLISHIIAEISSLPGQPDGANIHHEKIFSAIKNHDPATACEYMRDHLLEVETTAGKYLFTSDGQESG